MSFDASAAQQVIQEIKDIINRSLSNTTGERNLARIACCDNIKQTLDRYNIPTTFYKVKFIYNYFCNSDDYGDIGNYIVHPGVSANKAKIMSLSVTSDIRYYDIFTGSSEDFIINTPDDVLGVLSLSQGSNGRYGPVLGTPFEALAMKSSMPWIYSLATGDNTVYPDIDVITSNPLWPSIEPLICHSVEKQLAVWFSSMSPDTLLSPIVSPERIQHYKDAFEGVACIDPELRPRETNNVFGEMIVEMTNLSPVHDIDPESALYKRNFNHVDKISTVAKILSDHLSTVTTIGSDILGCFN